MDKYTYEIFSSWRDLNEEVLEPNGNVKYKDTANIKKIKSSKFSDEYKAINIMGELGYELIPYRSDSGIAFIFKKKI